MKHRSTTSLRGRIERALEMTEKLIGTGEYDASFTTFGADCPKEAKAANLWIKEQIRLYVKTWILPELQFALEKVTK